MPHEFSKRVRKAFAPSRREVRVMKAALFARYSSHLQDDMSLAAQLHEMQQYVAEREWTVVARYSLPETSSSDIERSAEFQQMLADAKAKRFDVLVLHKLDRLGRDREMATLTKAHLRRLGIEIRSVVENLGDGVMDRMMEGMLELFSDFYRSNLGQETRKGHKQLTRDGLWRGGTVPWGLAVEEVPGGRRTHKRLIVDPVRGPVMLAVFEGLAAGVPTPELLDLVESRTGERWHPASFYTRVRNPVYAGRISYGKTTMPLGRKRKAGVADDLVEGRWEGLVSEEVFAAAQAVMAARALKQREGGRTAKRPYILSKAVNCLKCGKPIVGSIQGGVRKYVCSGRKNCGWAAADADGLEEHVLGQLEARLEKLPIDAIMAIYEASLAPEREQSKRDEAKLRRRLTEVREGIRNLVGALTQGLGDVSDVGSALRRLKQEEGELAELIGRCQVEKDETLSLNASLVRSYLEQVRTRVKEAQPSDLAILFGHLFKLDISLETGEGQLFVQLAPQATEDGLNVYRFGRSARTRVHTSSHTSVKSSWCPIGFTRWKVLQRLTKHPEPTLTSNGREFRLRF